MSISKALELFFCCPKVLKLMLQNKIVTEKIEYRKDRVLPLCHLNT